MAEKSARYGIIPVSFVWAPARPEADIDETSTYLQDQADQPASEIILYCTRPPPAAHVRAGRKGRFSATPTPGQWNGPEGASFSRRRTPTRPGAPEPTSEARQFETVQTPAIRPYPTGNPPWHVAAQTLVLALRCA